MVQVVSYEDMQVLKNIKKTADNAGSEKKQNSGLEQDVNMQNFKQFMSMMNSGVFTQLVNGVSSAGANLAATLQQGPEHTIYFHVIEARNLKPPSPDDMIDPVCVVNITNVKLSTKQHKQLIII